MIIPIGHDQQTVRRLPWVSFALIALNIVVFLGVGGSSTAPDAAIGEAGERVLQYWIEHPHLEPPSRFLEKVLPPREREQIAMIVEAAKGQSERPADTVRDREQRTLDAMEAEFFRLRTDHPVARWGLVPNDFSVPDMLRSMFMHAGWMHLIGNMFFLYLAGPSIEDAYGRPGFTLLYLLGGTAASLAHVVAFPSSDVPLVGASGAVAALMGAFLIRCARTKIRFFYWIGLFWRGTFDAPAWLMLPLWLLEQLFYASLVRGEGGVAYWAHVAGFVFGAVVAIAIKTTRVEERYIHPAIEKQISLQQHSSLDEGMGLLAQGDNAAAREAFARVLADDPRNPDAHLGIWQSWLHQREAGRGAEHLVRVIEEELRRGERNLALDHWRELRCEAAVAGPAALRWRLAGELQPSDAAAARELLESLATDPDAGLLAEKARARLGLPIDAAAERPRVEATIAEPRPVASAVAPPQPERVETAEAGTSQPGSSSGVEGLIVEACSFERLQEEGLVLRGAEGAAELLLFSQIEAIAVAGVQETGGRPYLVLDLVLGPIAGARPVFRAISTQLDPASVIERPGMPPLEAFHELVARLVRAAGAPLLPPGLSLARPRVFSSRQEYEASVLRPWAQAQEALIS